MNEYEEPFRCVEVAADRAAEQVLREDKLLHEAGFPGVEHEYRRYVLEDLENGLEF